MENTANERKNRHFTDKDRVKHFDLIIPTQTNYPIGKYGHLHLAFIKEHRKGTYITLLTEFRLNEYLHEIDVRAKNMVLVLTEELAKKRGITEEMKSADMLRWVQKMNNCKKSAEEIVLNEIVYG